MKTTGNANITLLQSHELLAKIMYLGIFEDWYAQYLVCDMLYTLVHMR